MQLWHSTFHLVLKEIKVRNFLEGLANSQDEALNTHSHGQVVTNIGMLANYEGTEGAAVDQNPAGVVKTNWLRVRRNGRSDGGR